MKKLISEMKEGEKVAGVYMVQNKHLATTRSGKPFLTLKVGDRSGIMEAKVWESADQVAQEISTGDFVKVSGQVNEYNGTLQLNLQSVCRIDETGIDPADFLPSSKRNPEEMLAELTAFIGKIKDPHFRKLLKKIFQDPVLKEKLMKAPAAKAMHHAFIGGLLEHTLSLSQLCESVAPNFPEIDLDLLRAGVLLHDIGKVDELAYSRNLDYTDRGRLIGHIVLELEQVSEAIRSIPDFPEEKAILLKHLLASHHGREEFGSPVKPMILEALILHMMDDLDAKAQVFRGLIDGSGKAGETGPNERWSAYHSLLGQYVFKGFPETKPAGEKEDVPPSSSPEEDKDYPSLF